MKKHITIPIFIPHAGCPHCCVFCNQHRISGNTEVPDSKSIIRTIDSCLKTMRANTCIEIGFFGGSFTSLTADLQEEFLAIAARYINNHNEIDSIRLSTRPDSINREGLELLKNYSVKTIELGVQSFDEKVLLASGRGHSVHDIYQAAKLIKKYGFKLGIQLMPGLPESSYDSDILGVQSALEFSPDCIRIYPTVVIKNTSLEKLYIKGLYSPLTMEEAIERCTEILDLCNNASVPVIRMGLHPVDISEDSTIIDGPYHTAFGFLVKSRLRRYQIETFLLENRNHFKNATAITLGLPEECYEEFIGMKKENILYLELQFDIKILYTRTNNLTLINTF